MFDFYRVDGETGAGEAQADKDKETKQGKHFEQPLVWNLIQFFFLFFFFKPSPYLNNIVFPKSVFGIEKFSSSYRLCVFSSPCSVFWRILIRVDL